MNVNMNSQILQRKKIWGTAVWTFFHTLAEKIHEDKYALLIQDIYSFIYRICEILPCGICSIPATKYLNNLDFNRQITCKEDFRTILAQFHNFVNIKTNAPIFHEKNLVIYAQNDVMKTYESLLKVLKPRVYIEVPYNKRHSTLKALFEELHDWIVVNNDNFL